LPVTLSALDLGIIAVYLFVTLAIGIWISRKASKSLEGYFLGGKAIPWYALGLSNASGMFDISGTMWMVSLLFVYGLKSVWIPWLWPAFNQIFLMVFLSIWLRRSGVMTGAQWIEFRFGKSLGAQLSHLIVVVFAIVNVIGFLAYGFIGIGKFTATFLPWQLAENPELNANLYGLIVTAITTIYVVKGGMPSVVFTEVMQFAVMTVGCLWVGLLAMQKASPELLDAAIPQGWREISFGTRLDLDWSQILPAVSKRISQDGWEWFSLFFFLTLAKGWMQSLAGPAPNYDMQRILSAKSPREAALMSGFVNIVLLIPRYMLVTGLTVLALCFLKDELRTLQASSPDGLVDFDLILPMTMRDFIPHGLLGLLIVALLAAFMSTYAATVNAAPAYLVNDIYKRYVNPTATDRKYVAASYLASIAVVIIGTAFGFLGKDLNGIVQWLVNCLYGGYTAANMLKWFWWRFNSYGYFWGMLSGIIAAGAASSAFPNAPPIYTFPAVFGLSLAASLLGSLLTPPDDLLVLKEFYRRVRPWGFWKPIHELLEKDQPGVLPNRDFYRDMFNVVIGIVWHTSLTATGIYLVLEDYHRLSISLGAVILTSLILKWSWLNRLQDHPDDEANNHSLDSARSFTQ
jgi:solute:Na+ symporter, SSS family